MDLKYLEPVDDGLPMRNASEHTKNKLLALKSFIEMFLNGTKNMPWRAWNYLDLQAGPGRVKIRQTSEIISGSPLIALETNRAFTNCWFVDIDPKNVDALKKRTSQIGRSKLTIICGNCNVEVNKVVEQINATDSEYREGVWSSLNLAFLDPEGLELEWTTVEKLATVKFMDLVINFSTSGFTRNVETALEKGNTEKIDCFFGTTRWLDAYRTVRHEDGNRIRREMINFYKRRLANLGYIHVSDDLYPDELVVKNSKGVQQYTLLFISKSDLGRKFGREAASRNRGQRKLPFTW